LSQQATKITYGTAEIQGFAFEDNICLGGDSSPCTNFQILAAYEAKGIESGADGILGLSPNREQQNQNFHLLWKLKE
jgi:hypothetical protein